MCEMQNIHTIYVILLKSLIHLWKKQVTYECIWFTYIHYHDQNVDFCVKIWISCDFMCNIFVFGGVKPTAALLRRKISDVQQLYSGVKQLYIRYFPQEENEQDNFAYKFLNKRFPVFAHQIYNIHPQFKLRFRGKGPLKAPCETCSLILASFTNLNNMIRKYIISCTFTL